MVEFDIVRGDMNAELPAANCGEKTEKQANFENGNIDDDCEVPNLELIRQVRCALKIEFENEGENFSEVHYKQIMDEESPLTCWRYLVHLKKNPEEAVDLIKRALIWRKQNQVDHLSNEQSIKEFWHYSPIAFTGVTKDGQHQVLYTIGKNYRKPDSSIRQIIKRFCMNLLFGFDNEHLHNMRKFVVVFDVSETGIRNIDLDFMQWLVSISDFIPARIHQIYVVGIPLIVRPLIRLIISWLPDRFGSIVHCGSYEQLVLANIDLDNLPTEVGGTRDESYRLAPIDAPWQADSTFFSETQMNQAIEDAIGFGVSNERRDLLRSLQLEHDEKALTKMDSYRSVRQE